MYKKIFVFAVLLALVTALYGCGCNGTVAPTPTPTTNPTSSPTAEIIEPLPDTSMLPENSGTPETSADPGTAGQGAGGTTGGTTGGTGGTAGTTTGGAGITNFSEGTEVQTGDVPQVESAIKSKYSNATVQSIKHATKNNEQVYAVEIKSGTTTQTVYVRPDGTVLD